MRALCITVALCTLSACATAPSQPLLDDARAMCAAGHTDYCRSVPLLQAHVNAEQQQQARETAIGVAGVLGALAIGAAAAYGASQPVYTAPPVVILCRWRC